MKNENVLHIPSSTLSYTGELTKSEQDLKKKFFPKGISLVANCINGVHKVAPFTSAKMTMFLLSLAIRRPLKKEDHEFYQQGQKQTLIHKKKKFNTYTFGSGPKVLFIHGWASNGARWKSYVDKIVAKGYSAVVVDAHGQGTSKGFYLSIPDYIKCIRQVILANDNWYGIVSHSIGSLVGVIAASEAKGIFQRLKIVMMCTFSNCDNLMTKYARCMGINEKVLGYTKNNIGRIYDQQLSYFCLLHHYQQLNADGLLMYNPNDIVVPHTEAHQIRNSISNLKIYETKKGGHNLKLEIIEQRVIQFLEI